MRAVFGPREGSQQIARRDGQGADRDQQIVEVDPTQQAPPEIS
jgi:hypothetical protein